MEDSTGAAFVNMVLIWNVNDCCACSGRRNKMKILLAEDDYATRKFMADFLSKYGDCDVTVDGMEAVDAFSMAMEDGTPYDLVCLDIMMTTALTDEENVKMAFSLGCSVYSGKPIDKERFEQALKKLGLL
jgi:two-component system chemotaxis response regulator CheY